MRTHVILRDELVEEVDKRVGKRRRSEFINEAVEVQLKRLRLIESAEEAGGSLKGVDIPGWETEESTLEWVRKMRTSPDPWDEDPDQEGC
jgi:metal-responsive CopG/Arc/MetJ family transcriptional regulator